jgi:hypothetical protein
MKAAVELYTGRKKGDTNMAKRSGMYSYDKRQKELKRKKKQEEKRLRRQKNAEISSQGQESSDSVNTQPESSEDVIEATGDKEDGESFS